jgi:hypothetical protein
MGTVRRLVPRIAVLAIPFLALFLLVTVVGAPLALADLLLWIVVTLASIVFAAYSIARLLVRGKQHPIVAALFGGVILICALILDR